jgi:ubiquinone/menaquinone biosynthesis C-methylase UbiE
MDHSAVPARGHVLRSHLGFYDLVARLLTLGQPTTLHQRMADLPALTPGDRVLDVGCGTGSLAVAAKAIVGAAGTVQGIDASAQMIERAGRKAWRRHLQVGFQIASAEALPFPDRSFDVVFSTLMMHHLPQRVRRLCACEMARVLRPGGRAVVVDFQAPSRARAGWLARLHRHGAVTSDDIRELLRAAGFSIASSGQVGVADLHFTLATTGASP